MATAQARQLNEATDRQVLVVGRGGIAQWHEVFENNPRLARRPGRAVVRLQNGSGMRPYIQGKTAERWYWRTWNIQPGEIYLSPSERQFGLARSGRILIEPNTKVVDSNKAWLWDRWQELVDRGGEFVQVGPVGTKVLRGVKWIETPTFRHACAVLAFSRAFVGTEGGLHHAAAALAVPSVVLWSEFISPEITGYPTQRNLRHAGPACGMRLPCAGCRASMAAITVDEVKCNLEEITNEATARLAVP